MVDMLEMETLPHPSAAAVEVRVMPGYQCSCRRMPGLEKGRNQARHAEVSQAVGNSVLRRRELDEQSEGLVLV